jgi:hypothetical protein
MTGLFLVVCPVGHTHLEVKVLYGPDSGSNPASYPILLASASEPTGQ